MKFGMLKVFCAGLLSLLLSHSAFAETRESKQEFTDLRTPLLKLDERETATVAITALERFDEKLKVRISFVDEKGEVVAKHRGTISKRAPTTIASLTHDSLGRLDAAFLRVVVETGTTEPVDGTTSCGIGVSVDTDGPVFAVTTNGCSCGTNGTPGVFLNCPETGPGAITSGN